MYYKLTKQLQRIYDLLNTLIDADKPLSKQEASRQINCSRPTLDKTIVDANLLISKFTTIEYVDNGLFLSKKDHLNKRQVSALISNQTFMVQFLSDLLLGNVETLEDWAAKYYYSISVAYRHSRELTAYLKQVGIELINENNYWYLSGDAWQIRFFYLQMLKEKAVVDDLWVFQDLDYNVLNKFVKLVAQELEVFLSPAVEYFYTIITAVHLSMTDNPYAVESIDDEKFKFLLEDHAFDNPLELIEDYLDRPLTFDEKAMLVSSIELFPVKYLSEAAMHRRVIHSSMTDHNVYQLALDASQAFYPQNSSLRMMVSFIDAFAPLQLLESYHEFNYDSKTTSLSSQLKKLAGTDFNRKIVKMKTRIKDKKYAKHYFRNQVMLNQQLYIIYKTFSQENILEPVRVTFLSEKGFVKEQFYRQQFLSLFSDDRLEYVSAQEVHQNNLWSAIDLVVTDFTLARFAYDGRIVYINEMVTPDSLKKLESIILELELAKMQKEF